MSPRLLPVLVAAAGAASATAQWTQLTPPVAPPARSGAAMASDPSTNSAVLFGGSALFTQFADTWRFDGTGWTQLSPAVSPPAKFFADLVFDSGRGVYVLYGGNATYTSPGTNETWEFDGVVWTQRFPAANPGNLGLHAMAYDSARGRTVLYGGMPGGNPILDSNRTWEWDGASWTQRFPATNPGRLEAHSMCFHAEAGLTILFGGVNATSGASFPVDTDKTWAWDGTNWSELPVAGARPPVRERARLAYDPVRRVCVLVGGMHYSNGQPRNDTWELRLDAGSWRWTLVPTPGVPANFHRFSSTLAWLPAIGGATGIATGMLQFGGQRGTSTSYGDTWRYDNPANVATTGAGCSGTNGVPQLAATGLPRVGQPFTLQASGLNPAFGFAALVLGLSSLPPIDLGPLLGMPGCSAYQSADLIVTMTPAAAGTAQWSWTPVASATGVSLFCQALCLDPPANSFGFTVSNGLAATIGQ
jgi:hypothetical protein